MLTWTFSFKGICHTLIWGFSFKGPCQTFTWALSFKLICHMFTLALSFKGICHTFTWALSFKGVCHTFTWALSFRGSVGSDEIGFMLLSSDLAYSLSVFSRRRYKSRWKVRCIADKVKQRSLMLIRGSMDCNTDHINISQTNIFYPLLNLLIPWNQKTLTKFAFNVNIYRIHYSPVCVHVTRRISKYLPCDNITDSLCVETKLPFSYNMGKDRVIYVW